MKDPDDAMVIEVTTGPTRSYGVPSALQIVITAFAFPLA